MSGETKWLEIKKEYLNRRVDGEKVNLAELARQNGVKASTLRSRKNREAWDDFLESVATLPGNENESVATGRQDKKGSKGKKTGKKGQNNRNKTKANIKRSIAMQGNKNAVGNSNAPPLGNKRAEKHGFYAKYLPADTLELFDEIEEMNQLEFIWNSIKLKYAAIIRAQRIMFVKDQEDTTEHLRKHKVIKGMSYTEEKEWELQFAWDKYATFLQAQSRAMGELRSLIKQYDELCRSEMATEEQKLRIRKLKVDIERIEGNEEELNKLDKLIEAIDHAAKS